MSTKKLIVSGLALPDKISIDACYADFNDNDSKSARIARSSLKRPKPGKLYSGLSKSARTKGHGNRGSVSQCEHRGA